MNKARHVVILYLDNDMPNGLMEMAAKLVKLGAVVNVRLCAGRYNEILDLVEAADHVICWR